MRKNILFLLFMTMTIMVLTVSNQAEDITCLSHLWQMGNSLEDSDGDGFADKITVSIVIPDSANAYEQAIAADIAARANLESLVVDFALVKTESEIPRGQTLVNPILIGNRLQRSRDLEAAGIIDTKKLASHQGFVSFVTYRRQNFLVLMAGSDESLLKTGRAFFLRWPYFWDIWGRETGATFPGLKKDLQNFFFQQGIALENIVIQSAFYEFPPLKSSLDSIKRLKFNRGEIKNLKVKIFLGDEHNKQAALRALKTLQSQHQRGINTEVLSYPGCAQISFELKGENKDLFFTLSRLGFPKRILTPGYKSPVKPKLPQRNFDLSNFFTVKGAYADTNNDKILDRINSTIIISPDLESQGVSKLASRLVLGSAGASFPLVYLDSEIEKPKSLYTPILIGPSNSLAKELIKSAKLKIPALQTGQGMICLVTKAFNPSHALAVWGADKTGLEKTLDYFSQTFPYFNRYQEGSLQFKDVLLAWEEFLEGKRGSSEAYFAHELQKTIDKIKDKNLDYFKATFFLPQSNPIFGEFIQSQLASVLSAGKIEVFSRAQDEEKIIFTQNKEFAWEGDEAIKLISSQCQKIGSNDDKPLFISLGVSESPAVRTKLTEQIETLLREHKISNYRIEVNSAYKQGFFWIKENVIPMLKTYPVHHILIRFAEEKDNFDLPKRFYAEPFRWLQELYPIDEIIAQETSLSLEQIEFEMKAETSVSPSPSQVYEVLAFNEQDQELFKQTFSPRTKMMNYMQVLPEWGQVKITTGWLKIQKGDKIVTDVSLKTDLEQFWSFYQEEILPQLHTHILKKTGNMPAFTKQPYFKRLLVELWLSEPDFKLGLDEEIVSSLEAIHDEIYFDTLDLLRGITEIEVEDEDIPEDSSRLSAPGNVLPFIHSSLEGKSGRVKIVLDDWLMRSPQMELEWKEKEQQKHQKKIPFPKFKSKDLHIPALIFDGPTDRLESLFTEIEFEKEKEYLTFIDTITSLRELQKNPRLNLNQALAFPKLNSLILNIKHKDLKKEEILSASASAPPAESTVAAQEKQSSSTFHDSPQENIVPTDTIISPAMCQTIVDRLSAFKTIKSYIAGRSYEERKIPVLEIYTPLHKYTSLPRLITFKPTLYLSGRQHANEVSATNYILKFAELIAKDKKYQEYLKKINFVLHPMENPDGAELAFELQKITPFHSLHAGRYSSLGMDIGYQVNSTKPLLPEAKVRKKMNERWLPDIYLNLHGYPSHEWVQPFSNYSPYLFRDYWIPRGWFAYYRALTLPIYKSWMEAGQELKDYIISGMNNQIPIKSSNQKFYNRYFRWAARWQPHMNYLERYDGLNLYMKRRSSRASKLTDRRRITFVEATPEIMDETAQGAWLSFLCQQGLAYLHAHAQYLYDTKYKRARLEEESGDRIQIQHIRIRPGKVEK